jgi:hypothetical protein
MTEDIERVSENSGGEDLRRLDPVDESLAFTGQFETAGPAIRRGTLPEEPSLRYALLGYQSRGRSIAGEIPRGGGWRDAASVPGKTDELVLHEAYVEWPDSPGRAESTGVEDQAHKGYFIHNG